MVAKRRREIVQWLPQRSAGESTTTLFAKLDHTCRNFPMKITTQPIFKQHLKSQSVLMSLLDSRITPINYV
jgi:hypothetical protein